MTDSLQLSFFLKKLFDDSYKKSSVLPTSREFIRSRVNDILGFNRVEFITQLSKDCDRRDSVSLLLSTSELWIDLTSDDWLSVMHSLTPRPELSYADFSGYYTDIYFLIRCLEVDCLMLMTHSNLSLKDKKRIAEFCLVNADNLFLSASDFEEMDGIVWCNRKDLLEARGNLISNDPRLERDYFDADSLRKYAEEIITNLEQ